jgi:hypothetical protein
MGLRALASPVRGALCLLAFAGAAAAGPYRPPEKPQVEPRPAIGESQMAPPAISQGQPLDLETLSTPVATAAAGRARPGPHSPQAAMYKNDDRSTLTHDPAAASLTFNAPQPGARVEMPDGLLFTPAGFTINQTGR